MATLKELDVQIEQLKARRARLAAKDAQAERARRTRMAIVVGGHVMNYMPQIFQQVQATLTRPADRELFGLCALGNLQLQNHSDPLRQFGTPDQGSAEFTPPQSKPASIPTVQLPASNLPCVHLSNSENR